MDTYEVGRAEIKYISQVEWIRREHWENPAGWYLCYSYRIHNGNHLFHLIGGRSMLLERE